MQVTQALEKCGYFDTNETSNLYYLTVPLTWHMFLCHLQYVFMPFTNPNPNPNPNPFFGPEPILILTEICSKKFEEK